VGLKCLNGFFQLFDIVVVGKPIFKGGVIFCCPFQKKFFLVIMNIASFFIFFVNIFIVTLVQDSVRAFQLLDFGLCQNDMNTLSVFCGTMYL